MNSNNKTVAIQQFKSILDSIQPLKEHSWLDFKSCLYEKHLDSEDFFSTENSPPKEMGFIVDGMLRMFYIDDKGNEWNKDFFLPSHFVIGNINPKSKTLFATQALKNTYLLCISFQNFTDLCNRSIEINNLYLKFMSKYFEEKQLKETQFLALNAQDRYLQFLKQFPKLQEEIPHYHIASFLGITPTQLSRIRKKIDPHQQM